jgi:integrase
VAGTGIGNNIPNRHEKHKQELTLDVRIHRFYNAHLSAGVGNHTVIKLHTILHIALERAVRMGWVIQNACKWAILPKSPPKEMMILDESQVSQLSVAAHGSRLEGLLHLALATGMRQMEILGLKWSDLDCQADAQDRTSTRPDQWRQYPIHPTENQERPKNPGSGRSHNGKIAVTV